MALWRSWSCEYHKTVAAILSIRRTCALLERNPACAETSPTETPTSTRSACSRSRCSKRKREMTEDDPDRPLLIQALASTLNGVAQGMRNTG